MGLSSWGVTLAVALVQLAILNIVKEFRLFVYFGILAEAKTVGFGSLFIYCVRMYSNTTIVQAISLLLWNRKVAVKYEGDRTPSMMNLSTRKLFLTGFTLILELYAVLTVFLELCFVAVQFWKRFTMHTRLLKLICGWTSDSYKFNNI